MAATQRYRSVSLCFNRTVSCVLNRDQSLLSQKKPDIVFLTVAEELGYTKHLKTGESHNQTKDCHHPMGQRTGRLE